jgi:hypothetical protein
MLRNYHLQAYFGDRGYSRSEARFGLFSRSLDPEPGDVDRQQEEESQQGRDE